MGMLPELSWRNFTASFGSKLDRLKKMQREKLETATALARTLLSTKGELGGIGCGVTLGLFYLH